MSLTRDNIIKVENNTDPFYIKDNELTTVQELERGSYGTIFHVKWNNKDAVIKKIGTHRLWLERCEREKNIMQQCSHRNIVAFYGFNVDMNSQIYSIVMEYMPKGDLRDFINSNLDLQWSIRYKIISGITEGVAYLHSNNILHLDLKPENVLLDNNYEVKLCDFGFAKIENQPALSKGGSVGYIPPEYFKSDTQPRTNKFDIYGLGITFWETITKKTAFEGLSKKQICSLTVQGRLEVALPGMDKCIPKECSEKIVKLTEECWAYNPTDRPEAGDILKRLK